MNTLFSAAVLPVMPVCGLDAVFPVHRIYCVGQNYAAHTIEMGQDPDRTPPFFFQKNADNLVLTGEFPYPGQSQDVHHEVELIVAIAQGGQNIAPEQARDHIYGYAVGLDMTRRDLQTQLKKAGRPWEIAKAFEHSAPCSELIPAEKIGHPERGRIWLNCNGEPRQKGDLSQMIWKIPEMIAYLSRYFTLQAGDLIFTGTPAGVSAVQRGDKLTGGVEGVAELSVKVI